MPPEKQKAAELLPTEVDVVLLKTSKSIPFLQQ